jgi:predicted DNA-binding transcriptional regulator YafY
VATLRTVMRTRLEARCEELDRPGWTAMRLRFPSVMAAASMLAGFAGDVEVVSPEAVRDRLRDIARGLAGLYGDTP